MSTMKAFPISGPGKAAEVFLEKELPAPAATNAHELLVRVKAISMNPIDYKVRQGLLGPGERVIGYDASGVVEAVGPEVSLFKVGDEVFYAGDIGKPGTNSELHVVDERIVGRKPSSLSHAQAAALPLTSLTAWEGMLEGMAIPEKVEGAPQKSILVVAGAGGVGSVAIQVAKHVLGLRVVATASRPETTEWVKKMGADDVINHRNPYKDELAAIGLGGVDYVMNGIDLDKNFDQLVEVLNPCGKICAITVGDDPSKIDVTKLFFPKRGSLSWELMFARPMFGIEVERQHNILNRVADLVDAGTFQTTMTSCAPLTKENLIAVHEKQESGASIGKAVLEFAQ